MIYIAKKDFQEIPGALQVYTVQDSRANPAIHVIRNTYQQNEIKAVLNEIKANSKNDFKSINWKVVLLTISFVCPNIITFISNLSLQQHDYFSLKTRK